MASIVLTTAGTVFGGPVGGMVGNILGSAIDQMIFAPGGRRTEGPRLEDLSVQLSSYGQDLPRIYGRARVAGNVIWSTGLIETRHEDRQSSGGKGGGQSSTQVSYSYAASFAVALSSRPIRAVGRIWADGKLLRGANGELATSVDIRVYGGSQSQQPDPLIEAQEGLGNVPAFRQTAYVVFEELPLADYGNRIPNLTFEVFGDDGGQIALSALVEDICELAGLQKTEVDASALVTFVDGYSLRGGTSPRQALEFLAQSYGFDVVEKDGQLLYRPLDRDVVMTLTWDDLARVKADNGPDQDPLDLRRVQTLELPEVMRLRYLAESRDFQPALAQARRVDNSPLSSSTRQSRLQSEDVPLLLSPTGAKQMAEARLARLWQERMSVRFKLTARQQALEVGDVVHITDQEGYGYDVRLEEMSHREGLLDCLGHGHARGVWQRYGEGQATALPAQVIAPPVPSLSQLFELPFVESGTDSSAVVYWAVAGDGTDVSGGQWRGAVLYTSRDGGESYDRQTNQTTPAVMGRVAMAAAPGPVTYWDDVTRLTVALTSQTGTLESRSDLAVLNGANTARLGDEILQFATATLLPDGRYELSRLLRGRLGTEYAVGNHQNDEDFVLLDASALGIVSPITIGRADLYKAVTVGQMQDDVLATSTQARGLALMPYAPVHGRAKRAGNDDLVFSWIRRSRLGHIWQDGSDVPLAEVQEAYEIEIVAAGTVQRSFATSSPALIYSAADQQADFGGLATLFDMRIYQISDRVGRGQPLVMTFENNI